MENKQIIDYAMKGLFGLAIYYFNKLEVKEQSEILTYFWDKRNFVCFDKLMQY